LTTQNTGEPSVLSHCFIATVQCSGSSSCFVG